MISLATVVSNTTSATPATSAAFAASDMSCVHMVYLTFFGNHVDVDVAEYYFVLYHNPSSKLIHGHDYYFNHHNIHITIHMMCSDI